MRLRFIMSNKKVPVIYLRRIVDGKTGKDVKYGTDLTIDGEGVGERPYDGRPFFAINPDGIPVNLETNEAGRERVKRWGRTYAEKIKEVGARRGENFDKVRVINDGSSGQKFPRDVEKLIREGLLEGGVDSGYHKSKASLSAMTSIMGLIGAFYFFSSNITGYAISNMTSSSSNVVGTVFLIIGLVGAFFYMRDR